MTYSVRADSEAIFGGRNIAKWADLNNDKDPVEITDRVNWAIQEAYDQINSRLAGCAYTVPFVSTYDPVVVTLSARLTGVLLYDNRKLVDSPEYDEVQNHRRMVEDVYAGIHGARIKLLAHTVNAVDYPQAIISEET